MDEIGNCLECDKQRKDVQLVISFKVTNQWVCNHCIDKAYYALRNLLPEEIDRPEGTLIKEF